MHGAYGYSAEYGIERYFRARAPIIYEGTTQIHKMMQAEHALGYRNLNGHGDISPPRVVGPRALGALAAAACVALALAPGRLRSAARRRLRPRRVARRSAARDD